MTDRAPPCLHCGSRAELTTGRTIYPHRRDLWEKPIWRCAACDAHCGCHHGGTVPLGYPANKETRTARSKLHDMRLDLFWKESLRKRHRGPLPRKMKRGQVYAHLAEKMGLRPEETHTGMFTLEQCRAAWAALGELLE